MVVSNRNLPTSRGLSSGAILVSGMVFVHVIFVWLLFWASSFWVIKTGERNRLHEAEWQESDDQLDWHSSFPWTLVKIYDQCPPCMYISICLHFFAYVYIYIYLFVYYSFIYTPGLRGYQSSFVLHHFQVKEINLDTDVEISKCSFMCLGGWRSRGREPLWWRFSWRDGPSAMPGHIGRLQCSWTQKIGSLA